MVRVTEAGWSVEEELAMYKLRDEQVARLAELGYRLDRGETVPLPNHRSAILVDTATPVEVQCHLLGVIYALHPGCPYYPIFVPSSKDRWQWIYDVREVAGYLEESPSQQITKTTFRSIWVNEGYFSASRRRGLTVQEGLALHRVHPELVQKEPFLLLGSQHYRRVSNSIGYVRMIAGLAVDELGISQKVELTTRPEGFHSASWSYPSVPFEY